MRLAVLTALASVSLVACGQNASAPTNNSVAESTSNAAGAAANVATPAAAPATKEDALKVMHERHEGMEQIGKSTKAIKRQLDSSAPDVAVIQKEAATIAILASKSPNWFPQGTGPDVGKTGAKPEIWQNYQDFAAKDADFAKAAQAFNSTAAAGNLDAIKSGFADLGKTCKACHGQVPVGDAPLSGEHNAKVAIWDLPTRLFHWTLAGLIAFSWWSAEYHEDDLHIWSGMAVLTLLIFRLLWGVFGSSTARFANFVRGPRAVLGYLRGQWSGIGHNPLGALSVVALLGLTAVQVGLGLIASDEDGLMQGPLANLVSVDTSDAARDVHEALFDVLLVFIGLHVAAIIFYKLRGKGLLKPMITGAGEVEPGVEPMRPGKWWTAFLCLTAAIAITRWVIAGAPPLN